MGSAQSDQRRERQTAVGAAVDGLDARPQVGGHTTGDRDAQRQLGSSRGSPTAQATARPPSPYPHSPTGASALNPARGVPVAARAMSKTVWPAGFPARYG